MRYLKKHEYKNMYSLPSFEYKGFVYAPTTLGTRVFHTVYRNYRYVTDLWGPPNAVFEHKDFVDAVNKFTRRHK
jgi:hypothetical protein